MGKLSLKTKITLGEPWKKQLPMSAQRALKIFSFDPGLLVNIEEETLKLIENLNSKKDVFILTGFPCYNFFETDGPIGAVLVASLCTIFGCTCHLCSEKELLPMLNALIQKIEALHIHPLFSRTLNTIQYTDVSTINSFQNSILIAIERPGMNHGGTYRSMSGADISDKIYPIEKVIDTHPPDFFMAIGDGGNELGLGKFKKSVDSTISLPESIAARKSADSVVLSCTSNFGALCLIYEVLDRLDLLGEWNYSPQKESDLTSCLNGMGVNDGVTGEQGTTDGIPAALVEKMITLLNSHYLH